MKYPHWYYYKSILGELEVLSRYIEISTDNYGTYSIELTRLLLSAGSEIDVVAKLLCREADPDVVADNISKYREILTSKFPNLPEVEVSLPKYLISLKPWLAWHRGETPEWWNRYNRVKHERAKHFREANLENVLFATSGLCVFVSYLYHEHISNLSGITPLFMFIDRKYQTQVPSILTKRDYKLPDFDSKKE